MGYKQKLNNFINIIDVESVVDERLSLEDRGHDSSSSVHIKLIKDAINELID